MGCNPFKVRLAGRKAHTEVGKLAQTVGNGPGWDSDACHNGIGDNSLEHQHAGIKMDNELRKYIHDSNTVVDKPGFTGFPESGLFNLLARLRDTLAKAAAPAKKTEDVIPA